MALAPASGGTSLTTTTSAVGLATHGAFVFSKAVENSKPSNNPKSDLEKSQERADKLSSKQRPGQDFTPAGKEAVKNLDKAKNNGKTICTTCGVETTSGGRDKRGVPPSGNRTEIDHINKKRNGGSGTPDNGRVRCRNCNNNDDRPIKK